MPFDSLGDFLSILDDAGEIVRIAATVDPSLEIAEITRRAAAQKDGGPVLLFESVRGSTAPAVTNLLGSQTRLLRALNAASAEELAARLVPKTPAERPSGWLSAFQSSPAATATGDPPRLIKQAYCQQIVKLGRDVDLWEWPILRGWPAETHPVITSGLVITRHPTTGERSLEVVPIEVVENQKLVPHWHRLHRGQRHFLAAKSQAKQMPFALVLGGYPALTVAASASLPDGVDPYDFAGQLLQNSIDIVKCRTNDLDVPAHTEIVIEGLIDPQADLHPAAPVALPIGVSATRSLAAPAVTVTAMTHRANPIFPAQIVGCSPGESDWIRWGLARLFLPWLKAAIPELVDYHELISGVGRGWVFASIRKSYPRQAHPVLHALWGHPQTMLAKAIVVVDESVDVHNPDDVWRTFASNVDPAVDIVLTPGVGDVDENLLSSAGLPQKLGIDATVKLPEERWMLPGVCWLESAAATRQLVVDRWAEYGFASNEEQKS